MPPKLIKEEAVGKARLRLSRDGAEYIGTIFGEGADFAPIRGDDPEQIWRQLRNEVGKLSPAYFGYSGARDRFLKIMREGFKSPFYLDRERAYKQSASLYLNEHLPLESAGSATADHSAVALRAYSKAGNMLSKFENARVGEILRSPAGAEFVQAAAAIALGDIKHGLFTIGAITRKHGPVSWPIATYLPFFWRPSDNMFLKPDATREFADRVGHAFRSEYAAQLESVVYESLLDLARETEVEIADLQPQDRIDVQSFIWVVGRYSDADVASVHTYSRS